MTRTSAKPRLQRVVAELAEFHGAQEAPAGKNAFELILWEKVAYLAGRGCSCGSARAPTKTNSPHCDACVIRPHCAFAATTVSKRAR